MNPNQAPVPDLDGDVAEVELMLAVAAVVDGVPTVQRVLALAASFIKQDWGPPENINRFTRWFYGNNTKAAWCFIFISYVLAHAADTQQAGLDLIGGKKAFVPYIRDISGYETGYTGTKPGGLVALFDYDHIEFLEKDLGGGKIQTIGGNTEFIKNGKVLSTDAVARKERYVSDVSAHFNPAYALPASVSAGAWFLGD